MEDIYPTVIIKVMGGTAPFQYEVSLKNSTSREAPTVQAAEIRTGTYDTIEEVIACFEWELPERLQELIREKLMNATGVEFNARDAFSVPE